MVRKTVLGAAVLFAQCLSSPALADAPPFSIDIPAQPLASALQELARQTGIELLFDQQSMSTLRAPNVRGKVSSYAALRRLIDGSGLSIRRSAAGPWVVERRLAPTPAAAVLAQDTPVPEILVVGRRSTNVDITRRENDIQPYRVTTRAQIVSAHRDTLDQYFGSRITGNTQTVPPSLVGDGRTNSAIDLRGLGNEDTLILIDGRRMPGIPTSPEPFALFGPPTMDMMQPDINAIPLRAVERVETLTGTAGGIYGFGALGGVVNVVLRHDYRGAELHVIGGMSSRGDAARAGIEGRLGFTPDEGKTDIMVYFSRARTAPLFAGQRGFVQRNRREAVRLQPERFLSGFPENAIGIFSQTDALSASPARAVPLVLKPEYGGQSLGAVRTFLPLGFSGTTSEIAAALAQRAGQLDLSLTDAEAKDEIGAHARTTSAIVDLRHRLSPDIEVYAQALVLDNRGRSVTRSDYEVSYLLAEDPSNPFTSSVLLTYPTPAINRDLQARFSSERYTIGGLVTLPSDWRAIGEATFSTTRNRSFMRYDGYNSTLARRPGPLEDWKRFQASFADDPFGATIASHTYNRSREQSLRLAGPLFIHAGEPATLTMLAERRRETMPAFTSSVVGTGGAREASGDRRVAERRNGASAFYAEFRARLFADNAPFALLRDLDVQLAGRYDSQALDYSSVAPGSAGSDPEESYPLHAKFAGTAVTVGLKTSPAPWLLLRASFATGKQAPPLGALLSVQGTAYGVAAFDPKRGRDIVFNYNQLRYLSGGSVNLKVIGARTSSLGLVLFPLADTGPRISLDYSQIRKFGSIYLPADQTVLDHEDLWPERVVRAPLTDEDRELGYTGGEITLFDARAVNGASIKAQSLEGRVDWTFPWLDGALHAYAGATVQLQHRRHTPISDQDITGYLGTPLKVRANGGLDWNRGALTLGANVQYFSRYRVTGVDYDPLVGDNRPAYIAAQGSAWVPAQAYLDLYASTKLETGLRSEVSLDLGIVNVLDSRPPRETDGSLGLAYSRYGDPRQRRVEVVIGTQF